MKNKVILNLIETILKWLFGNSFHIRNNNTIIGALFTLIHKYYVIDNFRFIYPKNLTSLGFRSRFYFDVYESDERYLIKKHIHKNDRVLEVGGCIGIVSCLINKILENPYSHVVVEGNPHLLSTLYKNKHINQCGFIIENCIIGNTRYSDFYIHDLIVGGSADRQTSDKIEVVTRSFQELIVKHGLFSTLIMDIEGGEYDLIINNTVEIMMFDKVIAEIHDFIIGEEKANLIRLTLKNLGFNQVEKIKENEVWVKI